MIIQGDRKNTGWIERFRFGYQTINLVNPQQNGGQYYGPGGFMELGGYPVIFPSSKASDNQADAQCLWQVSEKLTGVRYYWDANNR